MNAVVKTTPAEDAALVTRCLEGDDDAWETLVARHGPVVWSVASRLGLSHDDASDVFQSTWKVALEEMSRIRDPAAFGGWISRVARHQSMRIRRGYGIARRSHEYLAQEDVDRSLPDEDLERLEMRQKVRAALGRVGAKCARLLEALYFDDPTPSYDAIAGRLGMRIGSIGPTRARCLAKMLEEIGGSDE